MKLSTWDIIFCIFIGPLPPGMFKTKAPKEPPPQELEVPSTEIGTPLGVLFGTRRITNPHVVWYGDLKIVKVKAEAGGKK